MRHFYPVFSTLGGIVAVFAFALLVPAGVSYVHGDGELPVFLRAFALTLFVGGALWLATRSGVQRELQPRDGMLLVTLTWVVLPLFAAVPLLDHYRSQPEPLDFTHAYFEAVSALTTTGSTVLTNLDDLPVSMNIWRTFLQWIGGMGILILAVAVLPLLGVGGSQLFKAESAGPLKDTKLTPRITQTAKGLWSVYATMSLACVTAYWLGGMAPADAWMHMFSTVSLGGLSSHDRSFAYFDSAPLEMIAVVFMLIASCNFALYFVAARRRTLRGLLRDAETRGTLGLMLGSALFVAALLWWRGTYAEPLTALRHALFNVVSIASTTGFVTVDYLSWPVLPPVLMLLLSGVATSAGSTGAGIKMIRLLILLKQAKRELTRMVHPRAVQPLTIGGNTVDGTVISAVLGFMLLYGGTVIGLTMLLLLSDLDLLTSASAVFASVNCMGPGLGGVGPASNFEHLTDYQTWVLTLAMLLGRLELLSFMVLFTVRFWRK
jgi:trk system potassium uptake protein